MNAERRRRSSLLRLWRQSGASGNAASTAEAAAVDQRAQPPAASTAAAAVVDAAAPASAPAGARAARAAALDGGLDGGLDERVADERVAAADRGLDRARPLVARVRVVGREHARLAVRVRQHEPVAAARVRAAVGRRTLGAARAVVEQREHARARQRRRLLGVAERHAVLPGRRAVHRGDDPVARRPSRDGTRIMKRLFHDRPEKPSSLRAELSPAPFL